MARTAKLTFGDQAIELPVIEGTEGELALDISSLRARTGLIALDPGLSNTGHLPERHHVRRRRDGNPPLSRHPHRAARGALELRRDQLTS